MAFTTLIELTKSSKGEREGTAIEGKEILENTASQSEKVLVAESCLTLSNPVDCSPPGCSVHEILQARILEWVAIPFSNA